MKPELQLKLSQQITLTPQLQQSIRLLQLSSVDLLQEVKQAVENNPLLDSLSPYEIKYDESNSASPGDDTPMGADQVPDADADFANLAWGDDPIGPMFSPSGGAMGDATYLQESACEQNLQDYLVWQANLTPFTDKDHAIALAIIDAIDERGYLTTSPQAILDSIGDPTLALDDINIVLKRIQHFDPPGVGALDLASALLAQLAQMHHETPLLREAKQLVAEHLNLLAEADYNKLRQIMHLSEVDLQEVVRLIKRLTPYPGQAFAVGEPDFITPDIIVSKQAQGWHVELNTTHLPHLKINTHYTELRLTSDSDKQFIRSHLQEARWLIRSIENRNTTLLRVAQAIVDYQIPFFECGIEKMRPMILSDIANQLNLHESTVSRVTTHKYLHAPCGLFELKYFFSSHIHREDGSNVSSTAIRALIKKLVATEDPTSPLSDNKLTELLAEHGTRVARRTVTKYRESLTIPASSLRKKRVL